ncbi:MAG: lysylphosphatidylglycerol synthase transmembrane domain-containing protein [Chloroflexota bacterium]
MSESAPATHAQPPGSARGRTLVRAAGGVLVSVACIAVVLRTVDPAATAAALAAAQVPLVLLLVALVVGDVLIRSTRWHRLLQPVAALPWPTVVRFAWIGFLANAVLPARLGEVVRSVLLGRHAGISRTMVLGTVVVERVLDLLVLVALAAAGVLIAGTRLVPVELVVTGLALAAVLVVGLVAFVTLRERGAGRRVSGLAERAPRLAGLAARLADGLAVVRDRRAVGAAVVLSIAAWTVGAVAWWVGAAALGIALAPGDAILVMAAVSLSTAIPSGPGYIGSWELAAVAVLGLLGVDASAALALGLLVHGAVLGVTIAGGAAAAVLPTLLGRRHAPRPAEVRGAEPTVEAGRP